MIDDVCERFGALAPRCDAWTLRACETRTETLRIRRGVAEPSDSRHSIGVMVTVVADGGSGYAATSDLSPRGLGAAAGRALAWARTTAAHGLTLPAPRRLRSARHAPAGPGPLSGATLAERVERLREAAAPLARAAAGSAGRIVDWAATLVCRESRTLLFDHHGALVEQAVHLVSPGLYAVAHAGGLTQRRSHGEGDVARQGGLEALDEAGFAGEAERVVGEALALVAAPPCPTDRCDLLLMPGQMALQIHESIGHPLELDRILGDERNYAGGSFVTPDMFGTYRYGSEHLDVVFDPDVPGELASAACDDEGTPAERVYLIRGGVLERGLGGVASQARAGVPGAASTRASDWDRPPIDRMGNVNVEAGTASLAELAGDIERGVLMDTNRSWSIDDRRDKFQFGCEYGRLVEDGVVGALVRGPGYRGRSATFWRSLAPPGGPDTRQVRGTRHCGKGEPNQVIHVGHASPACVFRDVEIFRAAMSTGIGGAGDARAHFDAVADALARFAAPSEGWLLDFDAETSDFVRFNGARVRQAGSVGRTRGRVTLLRDRCHATASVDLAGDMDTDGPRLRSLLAELRTRLAVAEPDPYLHWARTVVDTETRLPANLPAGSEAVARIARAARGLDLVGIWAAGDKAIGFANALGQRNWHACASFDFDWSLHGEGCAVKRRMAGTGWDPDRIDREIAGAARELELLARPAHEPAPGRYRAWISPDALGEIIDLLAWDAFGLRAQRTRQSPLGRLAAGEVALDARVSLTEGMPGAPAPCFTREGFVKPDRVALVSGGRHAGCLAGARVAKEYGVEVNATGESPVALEMAAGDLGEDDVLATLDDGLWIGNLWYLNFTDRNDCRVTGATRFACFRVEGGRLRAPLASMRFDQSLHDLLGPALVALGREAPLALDPGTYDGRSVRSRRAPGILVDGFALAL